ncbi:MAG TPA: hypothetical protein GX406_05560 [Pseudoclavibacter sp.]|nr:hypothetical protein [Pseudoclavibacter sp.]
MRILLRLSPLVFLLALGVVIVLRSTGTIDASTATTLSLALATAALLIAIGSSLWRRRHDDR